MKIDIGVLKKIGKGVIFWKSCKQKLVGNSLTETEIIGVDNYINQILWTKFFSIMTAAYYQIYHNALRQQE